MQVACEVFSQLSFTKTDPSKKFFLPTANLSVHAGFSPDTPNLESGVL